MKGFRARGRTFKMFIEGTAKTLPTLFSKVSGPHCNILDGYCNGPALAACIEAQIMEAHGLFVKAYSLHFTAMRDKILAGCPLWRPMLSKLLANPELVQATRRVCTV